MSNYLLAVLCCCAPTPDIEACCFENFTCEDLTVEECEALGGTPAGGSCADKGPCVPCDINNECDQPWADAGCASAVVAEYYGLTFTNEFGTVTSAGGTVVWDLVTCGHPFTIDECAEFTCHLAVRPPDKGSFITFADNDCGGEVSLNAGDVDDNIAFCCDVGLGDTCHFYRFRANIISDCKNNDPPGLFVGRFEWVVPATSGCTPYGDHGIAEFALGNNTASCGLRIL